MRVLKKTNPRTIPADAAIRPIASPWLSGLGTTLVMVVVARRRGLAEDIYQGPHYK
jgi:hypothetical protein